MTVADNWTGGWAISDIIFWDQGAKPNSSSAGRFVAGVPNGLSKAGNAPGTKKKARCFRAWRLASMAELRLAAGALLATHSVCGLPHETAVGHGPGG